jgi:hypothetical protein
MLGMVVIFIGLIVINAFIIINSQRCYSGTSCSSNDFAGYNLAMLCLGLVAFVLCLVYFGAFPLCVQKYIVGVRAGPATNQPTLAYTPGILRAI